MRNSARAFGKFSKSSPWIYIDVIFSFPYTIWERDEKIFFKRGIGTYLNDQTFVQA